MYQEMTGNEHFQYKKILSKDYKSLTLHGTL